MLVAVRVPKQEGKRVRSLETKQLGEINKTRISQARTVIEYCEQYVPLVIDGSMGAWMKSLDSKQIAPISTEGANVLLKDMPKAKGGQSFQATGSGAEPVEKTLAEHGVSKQQSHKWQQLAAIPEHDFEAALSIVSHCRAERPGERLD